MDTQEAGRLVPPELAREYDRSMVGLRRAVNDLGLFRMQDVDSAADAVADRPLCARALVLAHQGWGDAMNPNHQYHGVQALAHEESREQRLSALGPDHDPADGSLGTHVSALAAALPRSSRRSIAPLDVAALVSAGRSVQQVRDQISAAVPAHARLPALAACAISAQNAYRDRSGAFTPSLDPVPSPARQRSSGIDR